MQLGRYNRLNISKELPLESVGSITHKLRRIYMIDRNSCLEAITFCQCKIQFSKYCDILIYVRGPNGAEAAIPSYSIAKIWYLNLEQNHSRLFSWFLEIAEMPLHFFEWNGKLRTKQSVQTVQLWIQYACFEEKKKDKNIFSTFLCHVFKSDAGNIGIMLWAVSRCSQTGWNLYGRIERRCCSALASHHSLLRVSRN